MSKKDSSLLEILINDSSFIHWVKNSNQNDVAFWNQWIEKNPEKLETVKNARAIVLGIKFIRHSVPDDKVDSALMTVLDNVGSNEKKDHGPYRKSKSILYALLGTVLVLVSGAVYTANYSDSVIKHETAYGEIINLKLPDGTTVVLNGNSEISYHISNPRNIDLKGEAYFKVKSMPSTKAKFWVNTKDLRVEVYGTQFQVSTHEDKTEVLLDEGSIALLLDDGSTTTMLPGEMAAYSNGNKKMTHEKLNKGTSYALWRDGTYIFNNSTLDEVMKNLGHAYGTTAAFLDDELKTIRLSGGIPNHNLQICLSAIEKSTGTNIVMKDKRLIISKN